MSKLKYIIYFCITLGISSCAIAPTYSMFPLNEINLGSKKSDVEKRCGYPFRTDIFTRNHKKVEILYYKEPARIQNTGFIITTALTFENDSLISIIQNDRFTDNVELSVDSIRRR